jgi:2-polyprenyl-3-methyl-5-hydroxy-6-metoxy-1,4-benzoquinol methylase
MQKFASKIISFKSKLNAIDINVISNDLLVKNYLQKVIEQQDYYLKIYSWVLENALQQTTKPIHQISFLDFGCGNGLFAIFAKHCGLKKVYGFDFNKNFVEAANLLANTMNIIVDDWFVGNEETLFVKCNSLNLDIVAGTDVIEHIYSLNKFFSNIQLLNQQMITAFTTASVFENYFKRNSLYKLMYQDEYIGSNALEATSKDEFAGMAYLEIRKRIIENTFPQLEQQAVQSLAIATRGLKRDDIITYINQYLLDGIIKHVQHNKYNTCDPITGNFTERMMQLKDYKQLYSQFNFELKISSGFYAADGNGLKFFFQAILNKIITVIGNGFTSRTITPLILLTGTPHEKS